MFPNNIVNTIVNLIISIFTSTSVVFALTTTLGIEVGFFELLALITIITLVFTLVTINRTSKILSISIITTGIIVFVIYTVIEELLPQILDTIIEFFTWFIEYLQGYENMLYINGLILTILLSFIISLVVFIFTVKYFNFYIILISGVSLFVVQWIFGYFNSYAAFFIYMLSLLIYYFQHIYLKHTNSNKNEFAGAGKFVIWTIPIAVLVILFSLLFPTKNYPIEWKWMDEKIFRVIDYFRYEAFPQTFEYFSISETGFGDKPGRLGGKVTLDDTHVLTVESPQKSYLRGAERTIYTGSSWVNADSESVDNDVHNENNHSLISIDSNDFRFSDVEELKVGLNLLVEESDYVENFADAKSYISTFFSESQMKITFENIRTKSIFTPLNIMSITFNKNNAPRNVFSSDNEILFSEDRLSKGAQYDVKLMFTRYANVDFINLLKKSHKNLYTDFIDSQNTTTVNTTESAEETEEIITTVEALNENTIKIYETYLQLPENLPERISEISHNLTDDFDNRYDKTKAVERFLSTNFEYTLDPGSIPHNRDFVDYFLFDHQKGYCTYYASSMTVMLRTIGIPARYIEGYKLPDDPMEEGSHVYRVTNKQAHAWVEVYFEGLGWILFEPTAPYVFSFYRDHYSSSYSPFVHNNYDEYLDMTEEYTERYQDFDTNFVTDGSKDIDYYTMIMFMIYLLIALVILTILTNLIKSILRFAKYKRLPPRECILNTFEYYFKVLSLQSFSIETGETPSEYAERLKGIFIYPDDHNTEKAGFEKLMDIFILARYSNIELSERNKYYVLDYRQHLIKDTKMNIGIIKYLYHRFIIGKI